MPGNDIQAATVPRAQRQRHVVDQSASCQPSVDVDGGSGADTTRIGYADLDSNLPFVLNVAVNDRLDSSDVSYIDDYLDIGGDSYTITSDHFTKVRVRSALVLVGVRKLIVSAGQDQNSITLPALVGNTGDSQWHQRAGPHLSGSTSSGVK